MTSQATRIVIKEYASGGMPKHSDFTIETVPAPTADQLKENQALVRPLYLSVDPYQRICMNAQHFPNFPSYPLNEPISNFSVVQVISSTGEDFESGSLAVTQAGQWQTQYIIDTNALFKIDITNGFEAIDYVGVLGMPSFAAYCGLIHIGKPKEGETVLVSAASGAVGQMVVQIAKARGLHVIGVAGSDEKVEYVKSLGADQAFNYKTCGDYNEAIKRVAPDGFDICFDNVGGEFLDAALDNMRNGARIVICGDISQYTASSTKGVCGIKNLTNVVPCNAVVEGYNVGRFYNTPVQNDFMQEIPKMYMEGKIQYKLCVTNGFENAPQALIDMFEGTNFGKSIVKI